MKIRGEASVEREREVVFERMLDPAILARCLPGCEKMEQIAPGAYRVTVKIGIGAVKGTFQADVALSDLEPPESYTMTLEGKSPVGHARGSASICLAAAVDGVTGITYEGDARISGTIAAVGQRLLGATANKMARTFFQRMASEIGPG